MEESSATNEKPPSPFLTIWFHPRQTIHHIVETNSKLFVISITVVGGIITGVIDRYNLADSYCQNNTLIFGKSPYDTSVTPLWGIVEGVAVALFTLYLAGIVLSWVGKRLGGKAEPVQIRAAYAWSSIPVIVALATFIPYLLIIGKDVLACKQSIYDLSARPTLMIGYFVVAGFMMLSGAIWSFVLLILGVSEVHAISKSKAFFILIIFGVVDSVLSFVRNFGRAD